jgi:dimethylglycine dehydrogenase
LFPENLERLMPWLERAMDRMPVVQEAGIKRVFNGAISHSADGPPMLGPVAGLRNYWMCCGSSFGIAQGAGCGKYLAQWMLYGDADINMTGFDPRRFGTYADDDYMRAKGRQDFSRTYFTPLPGEELQAGRPQRTSPLHEKLKAQGCVHTETFGWERPKWFSLDGREEEYSYRRNNVFEVVRDECLAVRERVGILDLTGFAKYDVSGPDAESFLNRLCANKIPTRAGGITLTHVLSEQGRIGGEMTITRLADDAYYVLSAGGAEMRDLDYLVQGKLDTEDATITNVTDDRGNIVVAGPRARDVLSKLTDEDLTNESFRWLIGKEIQIAGMPVRALRVNYVGELGWELHPEMQYMEALYDAIWQAGEEFGIANFGLYAVNSLRIEKGYKGWGAELTNEITLLDADMDRFFKVDKEDFIGRDATLKHQESGRSIQLIYFEVDADDSDTRGAEPIYSGDECVGITTSGGYGHAVQKSLGFGYVDLANAKPGTELGIDLLGTRCRATVLDEPVYDPNNDRLRA